MVGKCKAMTHLILKTGEKIELHWNQSPIMLIGLRHYVLLEDWSVNNEETGVDITSQCDRIEFPNGVFKFKEGV